jgi:hypothetical protein
MASNDPFKTLWHKVSAAIRDEDCCGATVDGRRVFCDDKEVADGARTCACKANGYAALETSFQALAEMELQAGLTSPTLVEADQELFRRILRACEERLKQVTP